MNLLFALFDVLFVIDIVLNIRNSRKLKKQKLDEKSLKGDK